MNQATAAKIEEAPSFSFEGLVGLSDDDLHQIFVASDGPELASLAGFEWRGFNTPSWTKTLGIQKFIKGFFADVGALGGYNVRVKKGGLSEPWQQLPSPESPEAFGFFTVERVNPGAPACPHPNSVLLDYGASRHNRWYRADDTSMRVLRDYVVQPDRGNPNLLLGKAFIAIGSMLVYSNFFVLERLRPAVWRRF
jgi:hypothetical protein